MVQVFQNARPVYIGPRRRGQGARRAAGSESRAPDPSPTGSKDPLMIYCERPQLGGFVVHPTWL